MAEASVVKAITRELTNRGAWHCNLHGSVYGRNGLPDIIAIYRGHPLCIEAKNPNNGRLRKLQAWELSRARDAGATTILAHRRQDVTDALNHIDHILDHPDTRTEAA